MTERPFEFLTTAEGRCCGCGPGGVGAGDADAEPGDGVHPAERRALGLVGLLPHGVSSIDGQVRRV
jgi:hypothetical protein